MNVAALYKAKPSLDLAMAIVAVLTIRTAIVIETLYVRDKG
jgi:hypothetical protein